MKNLYIIGASHFGREIESWLERIPENERGWIIKGFLHTFSEESPLVGYPTDYEVIGGWETFPFQEDDLCVIAVANCAWKERIHNNLVGKVKFFTFVSPDAIIGKYNKIGEGSIICPNSIVSTNVEIGKFVTVNCGSQIMHDVLIGDYSSIMCQAEFGGSCKLEENVFVGSHANILPKINIGKNSVIGAGSIVFGNVKEGTTVMGNPARRVNIR